MTNERPRFGGVFLFASGGLQITPWIALPLARVEPCLDGVDHHRRERNFPIERVLAYPLVVVLLTCPSVGERETNVIVTDPQDNTDELSLLLRPCTDGCRPGTGDCSL